MHGGASSLGCGVTIMIARTRGLASRPVARNSRNDRTGPTRSAVFLIFFIVDHAVGNLHVIKGPGDFNVYGYFYVRLYRTGFGFQANLVEESVLSSAPGSDDEAAPHSVWNPLLSAIVHFRVGEALQPSLSSEEMGKVALTCHFACDSLCEELYDWDGAERG